jgi:hypothetical protein
MSSFKIEADSEIIKIDGFQIAPAEGAILTKAISFAGGMRDFPSLPPQIGFPPFVVEFYEDGTLIVKRLNETGEKLKFNFNTVDQLVVAINQAIEVSCDQKRLRPSPRVTSSNLFGNEGDVIEGR